MAQKRALITGITGQDGPYLASLLLEKGYKVYGAYRRSSSPNFWRLQYLNILDRVELIPVDLADAPSLNEAILISDPDEVYQLAAQTFVGASFEQPIGVSQITGLGVTRLLETIRERKHVRFYHASTSEMFGHSSSMVQSETTPFRPRSPYAAAKLYAHWMTNIYAEAYGLFACNGILFNHESPLRGMEFVTRKISNGVAKIALGLQNELALGNLEAKRDWGYAPDYVKAIWLILQQSEPEDLVIATGESHSVKEFAEYAFQLVDLDWEKYVKTDQQLLRPLDIGHLQGDASIAREKLGWSPTVTFRQLVEIMVQADLDRWQRWLKGEQLPWDAPYYPSEAHILTRALRLPASTDSAAPPR